MEQGRGLPSDSTDKHPHRVVEGNIARRGGEMIVPPVLHLDKEKHIYSVDGAIIPGTTTVLGEWIKCRYWGEDVYVHALSGVIISGRIMREAAAIGTAIHEGMYYLLTGQGLDWSTLHPSLLRPLREGERWIEEYKPQVILCEKPLYSTRFRYAGTPDIYCTIRGLKRGHTALIDIKSGMWEMVAEQLGAYEQLIREDLGVKGFIDHFMLSLHKTGKPYEFLRISRPDAFQYFLTKLQQYNYQLKYAA